MYRGILTKKARVKNSLQIEMFSCIILAEIENEEDPLLWKRSTTERRSGREAVTVYNIKYIPACNRSGWYPHPRIRSSVGINDASNKI